MTTIILQGAQVPPGVYEQVAQKLNGQLIRHKRFATIVNCDDYVEKNIASLRRQYSLDINLLPTSFNPHQVRLLISDMDSTLINIECIDEIADFAGLKPQVAAITEAAMLGELNFEEALTKRVALLQGLDVDVLNHVYEKRLKFNPGAEFLLQGLRNNNIKVALVSGGFTYFTDRLKQRLNLDYAQGNVIEIVDNKLTGKITGNIIGAQGKADFLLHVCNEMGISPHQAVAIGDGANDLLMLQKAGLSIAYHAKQKVQHAAHTSLNHCGLEGVLGLLNIDI